MSEKRSKLEEGVELMIEWDKLKKVAGLTECVVPVVVQDYQDKEVLMVAYANKQALALSLKNREATFWSTSRNELWVKGEKSGNILKLLEVRVNCEQNSLLYIVKVPDGHSACHSRDKLGNYRRSCFYRFIPELDTSILIFIDDDELWRLYEGGEGH